MSREFLEFLQSTTAQAVIWTLVLAILTLVGVFVVKKFRGHTDDDRVSANELLTNFREMNREGDISDAEFRTIKTVLGGKLQEELRDTGDEGT